MNPCILCRQCLVFHSEADESHFSTRESFGEILEAELNSGTSALDYWACSRESIIMRAFTIIMH